ncbi:MAG: phosphodiester glycosidase family protein [Acidimicrobiales bacterium]
MLSVVGLGLTVLVPSAATASGRSSHGSRLRPGSSLSSGSWLESPNGHYVLVMQRDGNLVLYGESLPIWASSTASHPGATARMRRDGNLVIFQGSDSIWSSGTDRAGDAGSVLVLDNGGAMIIDSRAGKALWRTVSLSPPGALQPFSPPPVSGEGVWHAAGRLVNGQVAIYETLLRPPGSTTVTGVAWMDPRLLRAALYSGSSSPGSGPWNLTAPIGPSAARTLVAAFNGGFKFPASEGGYYAEGRLVYPLRVGGASLVIYANGDATVGQWGRDVTMTSQVIAVRQNLTLLVDNGRAVPGLNPLDTSVWGSTLGGIPNVWRSGLGVTANGALVYVTGPSLEITQLAALLVRAGCVRAMTLDMNPDWPVFATYNPPAPTGLATAANGQGLLSGTVQGPFTFFEPSWARDFITMSAR